MIRRKHLEPGHLFNAHQSEMLRLNVVGRRRPEVNAIEPHSGLEFAPETLVVVTQHIPGVFDLLPLSRGDPQVLSVGRNPD